MLDPLREYFLDPERAGGYFVKDAAYTRLSLRIFAAILNGLGSDRVEQDGGENEDEDEALWHSCVKFTSKFYIDRKILAFSINILPFFLSKADYRPTLDRLARTLLNYKTGDMLDNLQPEMETLHDGIYLYLSKRPLALNSAQEQRHRCTTENQVPDESIDTCISVSDQRVESQKRQRNTSFNSAIPPPPPSTSWPFKRLRIVDMLNGASGS
ncbi:hypothetical protein GALMADRAFT_1032540 [Galerina marginata CBS 339.88]|uniref:Uncharacterized protein n=1 Tax=Galerina marginata (strain CBS 339.88) TaxID=685588 RepID=A0A067SC92_GALM3|nr:hypothetical protein GALMADRAFT_1032540 [Galerina marginata CBS 339.88]